jgi:hypothetical protein
VNFPSKWLQKNTLGSIHRPEDSRIFMHQLQTATNPVSFSLVESSSFFTIATSSAGKVSTCTPTWNFGFFVEFYESSHHG